MISRRKANLFLWYIAINLILLGSIFVHASVQETKNMTLLREKRDMVKKLELTDLCLFTEASYTRHLSQADLHTAFQDYPLSLEHFPSGSFIAPPPMIKRMNGKLD
jgi:hypothetical protein